jgi:hypothetical protein
MTPETMSYILRQRAKKLMDAARLLEEEHDLSNAILLADVDGLMTEMKNLAPDLIKSLNNLALSPLWTDKHQTALNDLYKWVKRANGESK